MLLLYDIRMAKTVVFIVTTELAVHGFIGVSSMSGSGLIFIKSLRCDLFKIEQ